MNKTIYLSFIIFLHHLFIMPLATRGQNISNNATDSLRKVMEEKTGADKISARLDLSLQILTADMEEALKLAKLALQDSKTIGDKKLEMRSFYMLGKIYTELNKNDISPIFLDSALQITQIIDDNWYKGGNPVPFRSQHAQNG